MTRFVLTRLAQRDLTPIRTYLLPRAGPAITRRVLQNLQGAMRLLARRPDVGHLREDLTLLPVRFWSVYSYLIVYDPLSKPLRILRVLHGMRDLETTLDIQ